MTPPFVWNIFFRMLDLQNDGNEESSTDTVITDSGIGSKTEVDTL